MGFRVCIHEKTRAAAAPMKPKKGATSSPLNTADVDMMMAAVRDGLSIRGNRGVVSERHRQVESKVEVRNGDSEDRSRGAEEALLWRLRISSSACTFATVP